MIVLETISKMFIKTEYTEDIKEENLERYIEEENGRKIIEIYNKYGDKEINKSEKEKLIDIAIKNDKTELLNLVYFRSLECGKGIEFGKGIIERVIEGNKINILEWLYERSKERTFIFKIEKEHINKAIEEGKIYIVDWLYEKSKERYFKFEYDSESINEALKKGMYNIVYWFYNRRDKLECIYTKEMIKEGLKRYYEKDPDHIRSQYINLILTGIIKEYENKKIKIEYEI